MNLEKCRLYPFRRVEEIAEYPSEACHDYGVSRHLVLLRLGYPGILYLVYVAF